jgi:hypothetical protein
VALYSFRFVAGAYSLSLATPPTTTSFILGLVLAVSEEPTTLAGTGTTFRTGFLIPHQSALWLSPNQIPT